MKPFLLGLNQTQAHEAGNLLSAVVLQQVRSQELGDVLNGNRPISDYPRLAQAILSLATAADQNPELKNGDWENVAGLLSGTNYRVNENRFDDEEERRFG
jgi:hypothetical protein